MIDMDAEMPTESMHMAPDSRYRTSEVLARNGPLWVMAAHDQLLNRNVAIAFCGGTKAQQREFTRQSQMVAGLKSTVLVDVYDCGSCDGCPFVVFERPFCSLSEAIDHHDSVALVEPEDAAREIDEALACLRVAGVEFGALLPDAVGANEAGRVRLSPWLLDNAFALTESSEAVQGLSGRDDEDPWPVSDLATRELAPSFAPSPYGHEQQSTTKVPAAGLPSDRGDPALAVVSSPDVAATTALVMIDRTMLSRPRISSPAKNRRPRSRYLAGAAALIVAIAVLGTLGSIFSQAGTPGSPSAAGTSRSVTFTPPQSQTHGSVGSPLSSQPAKNMATPQLVPSATPQPSAALATPTGNTENSAPGLVAAVAPPPTSTTTTTTAVSTSTTTVPVATTTTTVPASTTTTAPPAGP